MSNSIDQDFRRFKKIAQGKMRKNLQKYLQNGERIVEKGNDKYKVSIPRIDLPRFKFGSNEGMGQGQGEVGDQIGQGDPDQNGKPGQGEAGDQEGSKELEAEFSSEELADILGNELELPRIEPKGEQNIAKKIFRYNTLGITGPDSLKNMKKTFRNILKREISDGNFDPKKPKFIPQKRDFRYRSYKIDYEYESSATVFYIMDVSGSMGEEQKEMARSASFWQNIWLKNNYKDITIRYIIHDSTAKEVDEKTFFSTRESGGTLISSSYELIKNIIVDEKVMDNIYIFQYSDGDNWSADDSAKCMDLLKNFFLPTVNLFGYAQTTSRYGSGAFMKILQQQFQQSPPDELVLGQINKKEDISSIIKQFLGKGK